MMVRLGHGSINNVGCASTMASSATAGWDEQRKGRGHGIA